MKKQIPHTYTHDQVLALTRQWVESMVVGLNLCPFASPVVRHNTLRYVVSEETDTESLAAFFLQELALIHESDEKEIATSLLIMPKAVPDFYDYLDLLDLCEGLLEEAELEGVFQLASFHPGYLFGGVPANDISHWTNRSPFPMFHLIREDQMSKVLKHYKNPDEIPERNIQRLRELGREGLIKQYPPFADYT
jgi:hypothetical protein